jgi:O-antigen/teichoic acid export membrane protein
MARVARQSGVYALGNAGVKASGFVVAAIQLNTLYLPFDHNGKLGATTTAAMLLAPLLTLGLPTALLRFTTVARLGDDERAALPYTGLVLVAATAALVTAGLWPLGRWIGEAFVLGSDPAGLEPQAALLGRLMVLYAAFKAVGALGLVHLQARERAGWFSLVQATEAALLIGLNALFLMRWGLGLRGALMALVVAAAVPALGLAAWIVLRGRRRFLRGLVRPLLAFGAPVVVVGLSLPTLQVGDKQMLNHMAATSELSLYDAAGKVAGIVNVILIQAFQTAFSVAGLRAIGGGEGAHLHRRMFRHLCVFGGGFTLGLSLFAFDVLAVLTPKGSPYLEAAPLVLPLALGYFFYGLYIVAANPLYARGRTRQVSAGVAAAALGNLALNAALIPRFGAMGSAVATVVAYGALAVVTAVWVGRLEGVRFPFGALGGTLAVVVALGVIGLRANDYVPVQRWAAHGLLMGLYPLGVLLVRAYRWHDVTAGWAAAKAWGSARWKGRRRA